MEERAVGGCLPVARVLFLSVFFSYLLSFAFSCLAFAAQTSFHFVAHAATGISLLVPSRGFVSGLRAAYLFLPDPCCRNLPAVRFVCAVPSCFGCLFACSTLFARAFFSYLLPFPVWLLPLKLLFICRSGRDGPLLSSEKKVDKDSQRGLAPLNPHSCALRPFFPSSALLAGLAALRPQTAGWRGNA